MTTAKDKKPKKEEPSETALIVIGKDDIVRDEAKNPRAAQSFQDYLNMGDSRSIQRLAKRYYEEEHPDWLDNSSAQSIQQCLYNYSTKYSWANRIRLAIARRSAEALGEANKLASKKRDSRLALADKMMRLADRIFEKSGILEDEDWIEELQPDEARKLLKTAADLAKLGMDSERLEVKETLERIKPSKPVEDMTDDELEAFIENGKAEWTR